MNCLCIGARVRPQPVVGAADFQFSEKHWKKAMFYLFFFLSQPKQDLLAGAQGDQAQLRSTCHQATLVVSVPTGSALELSRRKKKCFYPFEWVPFKNFLSLKLKREGPLTGFLCCSEKYPPSLFTSPSHRIILCSMLVGRDV